MTRAEQRLYAGATLMKTMDRDSVTGCSWAFTDGETARIDVVERLNARGLLVETDGGLFPGMGQSYRLAPYDGDFGEFTTERFGPNWCVCKRKSKKLAEQYTTLILGAEYAEAVKKFDARKKMAIGA